MAETNQNLWAPWRMTYLQSMSDTKNEQTCFLCDYWATPNNDARNHVLWREQGCLTVLNRYPYTNGHVLIAPARHTPMLDDLPTNDLTALMTLVRDVQRLLTEVLHPGGFNVGMNLGRCAGAGLPGHVHLHVVPRWNGDTNFMSVLGDTRVVAQSLETLIHQLARVAPGIGLPPITEPDTTS